MRDLLLNGDIFMVRRTTEPKRQLCYSEQEVQEACKDPGFLEKVAVASPSMTETMDLYCNKPEQLSVKKREALKTSVMKYYARSLVRTTPFGLFAAAGIGKFGDKTRFDGTHALYCKKVNVDMQWLYEEIRHLEETEPEALHFCWNGACYQKGSRVNLLYSMEKSVEEVSVRNTNLLELVRETAKRPQSYETIRTAIQSAYPDAKEQQITGYLKELSEKEILISNLRPPFDCEDQLRYVAKQCQDAGLISEAESFRQIDELRVSYEETKIGQGIEKLSALKAAMKKLHAGMNYIQVDTLLQGAEVTIGEELAGQMRRCASVFVRLSAGNTDRRTALDEYRDKFLEKYGYKREVPLLELLDPELGIGAPYGYLHPQNDFYEEVSLREKNQPGLNRYLQRCYEKAVREQTPIILREEELKPWMKEELKPEEIPASMELYFVLQEKEGKPYLSLGANCGSFGAGKTLGRFSVLSEELKGALLSLEEKKKEVLEEGAVRCNISFLPSDPRSGNIVRARSDKEYELTLFTSAKEGKKRAITLEDIVIGICEERFYAKDQRNGQELIFETNHMFNIMLQPNALRFLQEIAVAGTDGWAQLPWKYAFREFSHVPEIRFEDIVVSPETWTFSKDDIMMKKQSLEEFKKQFLAFAKREQLPEKLYLTAADNRLPLDLSTDLSLSMLYEEWKKGIGTELTLERMEAGEAVGWEGDDRYATEIVVPFFRRERPQKKREALTGKTCARKLHMAYPMQEWLYLKLYGSSHREEELIACHLADFCEEIKQTYGVDSFFMRYADPKPHVRLRFHGESEKLYAILPVVMEWSRGLLEADVIGDLAIVPYEREVERYGGIGLIEKAEQLFFADSTVVAQIIQNRRFQTVGMELEEIAAASVLFYVTGFYETLPEQLAFLEANYHDTIYEKEWKERKQRLITQLDIETDWTGFCQSEDGSWLYPLWENRKEAVIRYREAMKGQVSNMEKNDIVASVLHLHCNRLLGTNRDLEQKVMTLAESVLYAKKYVLGKKGGYGTGNCEAS